MSKLREAEKDLASRGGGGGFVRLAKDETKDIRILEPTASMNNVFFLEVPIWWIAGKPITSPSFIGEPDLIQTIIDEFKEEFKGDGQAEFKALMEAKAANGANQVQKVSGFWIPILEFDWDVDPKTEEIINIYDKDGNVDPNLVEKFVKGGKAQIFDAKISLVKNIVSQITTGRGGAKFLTQNEGVNLRVSRSGTGRDTLYAAQKDDPMPMPDKYYGAEALDVVRRAKSTIFTDEYIEKILANYFFGEQLPEEPVYRFPELRDNEEVKEEPTRSRRGRGKSEVADKEPAETQPDEAPAKTQTNEAPAKTDEAPVETTRSRRGKAETSSRRSRSLVDDVANG